MDIPQEKQFHFHDGTAAAGIEQLMRKIETISYQEFYRHVNAEKNDFANWIRYVVKDERLADDLQKVGSIVETVEILESHLHPRPVIASRGDIQSRIEDTVIGSPLPALTDDEPAVFERRNASNSPPSPAAPPPQASDPHRANDNFTPIDLHIIEEKLGLHDSAHPPSGKPQELLRDQKVRDELFGAEDRARETLNHDADTAAHGADNARASTSASSSHSIDSDTTRLIVKDFIYGLIFGLVLGLILGRLISV